MQKHLDSRHLSKNSQNTQDYLMYDVYVRMYVHAQQTLESRNVSKNAEGSKSALSVDLVSSCIS